MPQRYDIRISFEQLERTAQEWLGWPFDKAALPQVDYLLLKEKGLPRTGQVDHERRRMGHPAGAKRYPGRDHVRDVPPGQSKRRVSTGVALPSTLTRRAFPL